MAPWVGLATTTIPMTLMTNTTMMTVATTTIASNAVGAAAGEQGGCTGTHGKGGVHAQIKKGNDDSVVGDGSLLEDVMVGIGAGAMNIDSPDVGTSDDNDNNDIHHHHPAGQSFWVQCSNWIYQHHCCLEPLDMSMVQRNFVSHYYSVGGRRWHGHQRRLTCTWRRQRWRGGQGGGGRRRRRTMTGACHRAVARD